ncbi:MAG: nucleotidyltransferase domain-containing protein [Candidatus Woesearchaeota archaeon]
MLTKEQLNILKVFYENLFSKITFKQIKEKSKQKSNSLIQIAINRFLEENLITNNKIGNLNLYSLNLDNNLTLSYLNLINEFKKSESLDKNILNILKEIEYKIKKKTLFFIFLVFGSYAIRKANKNSDLDIAFIVESNEAKKEITPFLETIKRRELIKIDYHLFTNKEFLDMLKSDYENLGKEIYKKNIVFYGYINYINLVKNIN